MNSIKTTIKLEAIVENDDKSEIMSKDEFDNRYNTALCMLNVQMNQLFREVMFNYGIDARIVNLKYTEDEK